MSAKDSATTSLWIRGSVTAFVLLLALGWFFVVAKRLGTPPVVNEDGAVVLDEFQRAKDILLVILPLVTTAFGYWFGAAGADKAEKKAEQAQRENRALVSATPQALATARDKYPEAFGLPAKEKS